MPDDKSRVGTFSTLDEGNKIVLKRIFEGSYPEDLSLTPKDAELDKQLFTKVQDIYYSCLNETIIDELGIQPLVDLLKDTVLPGFLFGSDMSKLAEAIALNHRYGLNALFAMGVEADFKNTSMNRIFMSQAGLNLPSKEYYSDTDLLVVYKDTIVAMLKQIIPAILPKKYSDKDYIRFADEIIAFETSLAAASKPRFVVSSLLLEANETVRN